MKINEIELQITDEIFKKAEQVLKYEGLEMKDFLKIIITKVANEEKIPITFNKN
ncbi:type II toxin-antitoxin system RelB/DinJ family antitoxin [Lactococcus lactis]|uniref:type II toxin-antitoxin system RelB/DinJ family antitoxin n=1 Tax=Lactococcus lactis TaxID=1358 RepID=UPI0026581E3E|nr:type II toxin-antitoxin system RelB/DinJ family antitoxin [Lactococcus lactis]WKF72368.1 type II toxin-antitoxin system RelB/DinJ family antitoxin [Lactococcus lactis]